MGLPTAEHFEEGLINVDPEMYAAMEQEYQSERDQISLIASENFSSLAVRQALGGVLTNKTTEGYPGARYLSGSAMADRIELLAVDRAKTLFGSAFANVQPHSGSQMNQAVILALLKPGDTVLSMDTTCGGHLSHGAKSNISGQLYRVVRYGVDRDTGLIDHEEIRTVARENRPGLLIAGGSSYPRRIEFGMFRDIADETGSLLLVDMSHFAGLVAAGLYPNPTSVAHVVTSTTYKSLRGPRGGVIFTNCPDLAHRIDVAVTPGIQDSPALHQIAAKAICFYEALQPQFRSYAATVLENARSLGEALSERNYDVVTGGTDMPFILVDLRRTRLTGDVVSTRLEAAGILVNKNQIPFDTKGPKVTSGIRLGSNAGTSRGLGPDEFRYLAGLVADLLDVLVDSPDGETETEKSIRSRVKDLCQRFPFYPPWSG
jgi:glycine hydroxymethyltransferase